MAPVNLLPRPPLRRTLLTASAATALAASLFVAPPASASVPSSVVAQQTTTTTPSLDFTNAGRAIVTDSESSTIAPGLELHTFARLEEQGWNAGSVLVVDLESDGLTLDHQYSGTVTKRSTVREMADASGATAAINGDFFDIDRSNAPLGIGVDREDGLITAPTEGHNEAFAVDTNGAAHLAQIFLEGMVTAGDAELTLSGVNTFGLPTDGIGLFTDEWGEYDRASTVGDATTTAEVTITDGKVTEVAAPPGAGTIAENELVLVGRDAGADALSQLEVGADAEVSYRPRADFGEVAVAIGGNHRLVTDGQPRDFGDESSHARSGIGLSEDGKTMFLVSMDGKVSHARGMTLTEFAQFMLEIGSHQALNIDGGGSSTLVVREPGTNERTVVNSPSDGEERPVANGLGLFTAEGSGMLDRFRLTVGDGDGDGDQALRVFPGLTRQITALGHDETYAGVDAEPIWMSSNRRTASVVVHPAATTTVTGKNSGTTEITARRGRATGSLTMTVLGELQQIKPDSSLVALQGEGDEQALTLTGLDIEGHRAPIDPDDLKITGGGDVLEFDRQGNDLLIRATTNEGSALLTAEVAGVTTQFAVTVGLRDEVVADFSDAADWTASFARATGDIAPETGPNGQDAVRLTYDFVTNAGNTRAAYANAPEPIVLPGQPQEITAWVHGDGNGTWIRIQADDRNGTLVPLNGGYTTFTGWQKMTFAVPAGTEYPLTLRNIYAVQVGDASYNGTTAFSDIAVRVAPDVEQPAQPDFPDPVLVTNGTVDDAPQRIAVMSDSQFVGRDPDNDIVKAARRTLREIVAADPDVLVINGDFVDEAAPEDFALARQILDEELAGVAFPWYYVPGNHEIQGGPIDNFIAEFGATQHTFDVGSAEGDAKTKVVTLNSSEGSLRGDGSGFDQIAELRRALDEAAESDDVTGVVVFAHHPTNDPLPADNSQLGDRREAAMIEDWLADFEKETGKSAAYVGAHAGVFHAASIDGVPYLVNGNSGKNPADIPENGGFTGWTMLGVDPSEGTHSGAAWLNAEVKARVDAISLSAPAEMTVDGVGDLSAVVEQDEVRTVPVEWPVAAEWGGDGVYVGPADDAPWSAVVAISPVDRTATGLRPGTAEIEVTVNGKTASREVVVTD